MSSFSIGDIRIREDGMWEVVWWGEHTQQGGPAFSQGNLRSEDLVSLLEAVANNMARCKQIYLDEIKRKTCDS